MSRRVNAFEQQNGRCWYCHRQMVLEGEQADPLLATREHVTPRAVVGPGFAHPPAILVCAECNGKRGTMPLDEWLGWLRKHGFVDGMVARIGYLLYDTMPPQARRDAFAAWMQGLLNRPCTPLEALVRLPVPLRNLEPVLVKVRRSA